MPSKPIATIVPPVDEFYDCVDCDDDDGLESDEFTDDELEIVINMLRKLKQKLVQQLEN